GSDTEGNLVAAVLQYRSASMAGNLARTNGTSAAPGTLEDYVKEAGAQQSGQLASFSTPIMFPGNRSEIVLSAYRGGEWPDPLSACHGYRVPSGLPITLELGPSAEPIRVSARSLAIDGDEVENCLVTAHTYTNSDPQQLMIAKDGLGEIRRDRAHSSKAAAARQLLRVDHRKWNHLSMVVQHSQEQMRPTGA